MKKIYIEKEGAYTRIAIKSNNILEELFIEEEKKGPHIGEIYKGVVKNILNSNRSVFIDIGFDKNCYMHLNDLQGKNIKKGDDVIVEVLKEEIGGKGAKVTSNISFQGYYCVLVTFNNKINYSKNIQDYEFKEYIRENIKRPEEVGIIIRSRAIEANVEEINSEIQYLYNIFLRVNKKGTYTLKPKLLYDDGKIVHKFLRNYLDSNVEEIITNNEKYYNSISDYINGINMNNISLQLYVKDQNLFSYYDIEKDIVQLRNTKVILPSGGYIVIDRTEAMYVIDVNTGKNIKHESMRKTVLNTNLEAAREIVRQIKLRNMGGIIVIDFIDMFNDGDRQEVISLVEQCLGEDKNKSKIYPFTEIGLLQITRKRSGRDLYNYIEEICEECNGGGKRLSLNYIEFLIKNDIYKIEEQLDVDNIYIEIEEKYKRGISEDILAFIKNIDALDKKVYINYTNNSELFKVEPLVFHSQIKRLKTCKVYG